MSSSASALVVDSVTGVEVALPVAGPGVRAYAFVIDWHIRAILAAAWYVIGMMLYNQDWTSIAPPLEMDSAWFGFVALPAGAIYFLYHPTLEIAMRGRTPGKRMAGVRIVTRTGGMPLLGAHLIRNVFRIIDNFPIFYGLGLIMTMVTQNHVRVGDLAAGTLLVYDHASTPLLTHVKNAALDTQTAELIDELLTRWDKLEIPARGRIARQILNAPESVDDAALRSQLKHLAQEMPA
jgi:uncharacterized RDD family membrane protein YckC